jgi:hypothetical protein
VCFLLVPSGYSSVKLNDWYGKTISWSDKEPIQPIVRKVHGLIELTDSYSFQGNVSLNCSLELMVL